VRREGEGRGAGGAGGARSGRSEEREERGAGRGRRRARRDELEVAATLWQASDIDARAQLHAGTFIAEFLSHGVTPLAGKLRVECGCEGEGAGPGGARPFALAARPEALRPVIHAQGRDAQAVVAGNFASVPAQSVHNARRRRCVLQGAARTWSFRRGTWQFFPRESFCGAWPALSQRDLGMMRGTPHTSAARASTVEVAGGAWLMSAIHLIGMR
jgi:hypothetical protein